MLPCCAHRARYPVPSLATFLYMPVRAPERRYTALSTPYLCLHLPLSRRRAHSRAALFVASFLSPTAQAQACIPTTSGHKTSQPATVTRRLPPANSCCHALSFLALSLAAGDLEREGIGLRLRLRGVRFRGLRGFTSASEQSCPCRSPQLPPVFLPA